MIFEGIDLVSTFYNGIFRLPPAHQLVLDEGGVRVERYWSLEPRAQMRLDSDDDYAAAFLERFERAVALRLRAPEGTLAAMLSGGMDSGSVVAIASAIRARANERSVTTFSAVSGELSDHIEDRAIRASAARAGSIARYVRLDRPTTWGPAVAQFWRDAGEPFDHVMTMLLAIYDAAARQGLKTMLDGVAGDVALGASSAPAAMLRGGRFIRAWGEIEGENRFYGIERSVWRAYAMQGALAFMPGWARALRSRSRVRKWHVDPSAGTMLHEAFARRLDFASRREDYLASAQRPSGSWRRMRAWELTNANYVVARERYERVAAFCGMETRDPYADVSVVQFCLSLPPEQLTRAGWPKFILRNAMAGRMDDAVRWRRGKQHHGWAFTERLLSERRQDMRGTIARCLPLREYVSSQVLQDFTDAPSSAAIESPELALFRLATWLDLR